MTAAGAELSRWVDFAAANTSGWVNLAAAADMYGLVDLAAGADTSGQVDMAAGMGRDFFGPVLT